MGEYDWYDNGSTYDPEWGWMDSSGSIINNDASGNPVVVSNDGTEYSTSEIQDMLDKGMSAAEVAKKTGTLLSDINSIAKSATGVATTAAQIKWFNDMKSALDKSRADYETKLAQLDSLKDNLGSLNDKDRKTYDNVRQAIQERIVNYANLADKASSAMGSYDTQSMNDFMGEIANYDPQTYDSLMGDISKYSGVKRSDMEQAMGQFQFFDPNRVKGTAGEIAATKTAALDRLFDRANSTGYANAITRGVDRSSLEDLRRSDVIQKFAPEYMSINNDSFKEALAQEQGLYQNYLTGRNAYTNEKNMMDALERSGLGFSLDAALKADANERAGLGFKNQSAIASDAASRASRLQPYAELTAQYDPSLKYGSNLMASDQTMSRNTLSNYTDLAKRLTGTAAGTYNNASAAYGQSFGDLVTALNSYAKSGGGSGGTKTAASGGGGGGGNDLQEIAQTVGTVGSIINGGMAIASLFSSEDFKEDKKKIDVNSILDAIKTMPIESWKYKDGIADGGHHIGPYAGDFADRFGGNGVTINGVDAIGVGLAGIQGLANKVDKLEKRINRK